MSLERRDVATRLKEKGFREDTDRDHDFYFLYVGEVRQPVYTKLSRGGAHRTLGDDLVRDIAHQMHLTKPQLREFVDCSLTDVGYIAVLRSRGVEVRLAPPKPTAPKRKK